MSGRLHPPTRSPRTAEPDKEFAPSEEWRSQLEEQATKHTLDKLHRIARARLGIYAGGKQHVHDSDVDEIVFGSLGDVCTGVVAWDPNRRSLFLHLRDVIRYRVRDQARLNRRRRNHDELDEDDCGVSVEAGAAAGAILPTVTDSDAKLETLGDFVDETIAALRPLATLDAEVTFLLDVLVRRVVDRTEDPRRDGHDNRRIQQRVAATRPTRESTTCTTA
ncbi:MAG: hypothetical protein ABI678_05435 [Kofleriaceae bacterium]